MKILIVANYAKEHINKFHLSTIKRLKEMGWRVDVACKVDEGIPECDHLYDLPIERNPFRPQTIAAIIMLRELIDKEQYDVIHCHTFAGKIVGILAASKSHCNTKIFYTAHGLQYYKGAPCVNWIFLPLDRWLASKIDLLITVNQEDYDNVHKYHFRPKAIAKHCGAGIKLERFQNDSGMNRFSMRENLGIPQNAIVLIYVAELNKNKNQEMLIRVFKIVKEKYNNVHLLLVGPDHSNGLVTGIVKREGLENQVHCLGWRSDIADLIRSSDIATASSYREGLGINLLEYMYCGIPVVATNNRGHREIIDNGTNGYLVDSDDDVNMAKRVIQLIEDHEISKQFVNNAKNTVEQFRDDKVVDDLISIYQQYS